ncbi:MAG: hypothetical protein ACE15C_16550 [Phycisphaerae bacterium]
MAEPGQVDAWIRRALVIVLCISLLSSSCALGRLGVMAGRTEQLVVKITSEITVIEDRLDRLEAKARSSADSEPVRDLRKAVEIIREKMK